MLLTHILQRHILREDQWDKGNKETLALTLSTDSHSRIRGFSIEPRRASDMKTNETTSGMRH